VDSFDPDIFRSLRKGGNLEEVLAAVQLSERYKSKLNDQHGEVRWFVALNVVPPPPM